MFGGLAYIPKSVRTAMKFSDYNAGRPLTARRIMAVKTAIESYRQSADQAFEAASEIALNGGLYAAHGQGGVDFDWNRRVDGLIAVAVNASVADPDALEVVKAAIVGIVKAEGANLRTEDQVKEKVTNILENIAELKAVAKGNARVLAAGKELLKQMGGVKVPDGAIRAIVSLTMKQSIGKLKSLTTRTSGIDLHKAVMQTLVNVNKAMAASGADLAFDGDAQAQSRLRKFCIAVQLACCSDAAARRIKELFDTDKAALVSRIYGDIGEGHYEKGGLDDGMKKHMEQQSEAFSECIGSIYAMLQERVGVPENERREFRQLQNSDYTLADKNEVVAGVRTLAEQKAQREMDNFLHNAVVGRGVGADAVRALYTNELGDRPFQPEATIWKKANDNILGLFNRNFCKSMKNMNFDVFKAELANGNINVVLPGNVRLTANNASNELASFLTHGAKTTFDELNEKEKKKFANLVAMLNPKNIGLGEKGEALALDRRGRDAKFELEGNIEKRQFSLSFDSDNTTLVIRCETERTLTSIRVNNEAGHENIQAGPGSKVETGYELKFSANEIDRLASISIRKYLMYSDQDVENDINFYEGINPHSHSHLRNVLDEFSFESEGIKFTTRFKLTVN